MRFGTADLDLVFFGPPFGVPCTAGGRTVHGIVDEEEQLNTDPSSQSVMITLTVLRIPTLHLEAGGAWQGVTRRAAITVDSRPWVVRELRRESDGLVTVLTLAAP